MKTFGLALLSLLSLAAAAPAFAGPADRSADKGVQLALDVRIGEGGVRIDDERNRYRDRDRDRRHHYRAERGECRTVITREYRHGEQITRKTRRCD